MSYVAIARKWRPENFDEIAGQSHVTRTLQNAIRLGRIHHAFLFTGARGVGKTTAARVLARALNCEQGPTPEPCGQCASCREIFTGASPDVIEIDGASNNSVDDVRELREAVRYLPQRGRRKIYIVDEVHMLSRGAFNALLKTLEEPPEHVVFIFATTEPQKIPDTILSRVQRFDFKRIPTTVIADRLRLICDAEGVAIPDDALRLVARAGEGSMRDAQSLLDRVVNFAGERLDARSVGEVLGLVDRSLLYAMLEGTLKGDPDRCLDAIEKVYGFGYDLGEFTAEMLELLRNATMVGLSPSSRRFLDVPDDERTRLEDLVRDVQPEVFVRSFQVMLDVHDQVARAQRPRLVLEMAVARLVSIRPARPLDQVVDRLGDLERRLRHGGVSARPRARGSRASTGGDGGDDAEAGPAEPAPEPPSPARPSPPVRPAHPAPQLDERFDAPPPDDPGGAEEEGSPLFAAVPSPRPAAAPVPEEPPLAPVEPPPALPPETPAQARFETLQRWLDQCGSRYNVWSMDTALNRVDPPVLRVFLPTAFKLENARQLQADPRLLQGVAACFPGCSRVEVVARGERSAPATRRELLEAERQARLAEVRRGLEQHELTARLRDKLGARMIDVCADDETPPSLDGLL